MKLCFECQQPAQYEHHVVPKIRCGTKTVPLCCDCHTKAHHRKGNMTTGQMTREALAKKRERGERIGQMPYGWSLKEDGKTLIKNEKEQEGICLMVALWSKGLSFRKIIARLVQDGFPPKFSNHWHPKVVRSLILVNQPPREFGKPFLV